MLHFLIHQCQGQRHCRLHCTLCVCVHMKALCEHLFSSKATALKVVTPYWFILPSGCQASEGWIESEQKEMGCGERILGSGPCPLNIKGLVVSWFSLSFWRGMERVFDSPWKRISNRATACRHRCLKGCLRKCNKGKMHSSVACIQNNQNFNVEPI